MGVIEIESEEQFNDILLNKDDCNEKKYVFVDFYAPWCGPCRRFSPILHEMSDEYDKNVCYLQVNVDNLGSLGSKYNITSLPTFMTFETGSLTTEHEKIIGASKTKVEGKLKLLNDGLGISDDF